MSLAESTRREASPQPPYARVSTIVGLMAALLVGGFVLTSSLIAVLPEFRYASQFPALLPFFAWAGATGVGHLANLGRSLLAPWRAAFGPAALVPWVAILLVAAATGWVLPWWSAPAAAVCAAVPFVVLGARAGTRLAIDPARDADEASRKGTFLIGLSLLLMAYSVTTGVVMGAVVSVLLAVALAIASLMTHGLARASRTWRVRHWASLAWGTLVVWAAALVNGLTGVFGEPGWVLLAVVVAGAPLLLVNALETRRAR